MQGIKFFEYKYLLDNLKKIKEENTSLFPEGHEEQILLSEEKLVKIYEDYRMSLIKVAEIIRQFDEHKVTIRKLVSRHKNCKKFLTGKRIW